MENTAGTLYRVVLPYAVAGVIADDAGIIRRAAPILRWAVGRPVAALARWTRGRGGTVTKLG
jgi:hypothetical protein